MKNGQNLHDAYQNKLRQVCINHEAAKSGLYDQATTDSGVALAAEVTAILRKLGAATAMNVALEAIRAQNEKNIQPDNDTTWSEPDGPAH